MCFSPFIAITIIIDAQVAQSVTSRNFKLAPEVF